MKDEIPKPNVVVETPKNESMTKPLLLVGCLGLVFVGLIGGLGAAVFFFLQSPAEAPEPDLVQEAAEAPVRHEASPPDSPPPSAPSSEPRKEHRPEPGPAPATKPPPPPGQPRLSKLDLSSHMDAVPDYLAMEIHGYDIKHLKIVISNVTGHVTLEIPAGLVATPATNVTAPAMVVRQSRSLALKKGQAAATFYIKAASLDFRQFKQASRDKPYRLQAPEAGDPVTAFLQATTTAEWNIVQAGVWALQTDITGAELAGCFTAEPDPHAPGKTRSVPVASWTDILELEQVITRMGGDPMAFQLFKSLRKELADLSRDLRNTRDTEKYQEALEKKRPAFFVGESQLEYGLTTLARAHPHRTIRTLALENLLELGLSGSVNVLTRRATTEYDINVRLAAAMTLLRKGDARALPLLAAHADDPIHKPHCESITEQAILKATKLPRNPGELMFAYWVRTAGWDSLSAVPDLANFRQVVESRIPKTDPQMLSAIEGSQAPDYQTASRACRDLRKYERHPDAFAALTKTVTTHKDRRVRQAAINTLWAFRDFDLAPVCAHVVKYDDDSMIMNALRLAAEQHLPNVAALHEQAARHASTSIRRQAADNAGRYKIKAMEKTLLRLYRYDEDSNIKRSALRSLAQMRASSVLPILQRLIRTQNRTEKYQALDGFIAWGDDPKVLDMLEAYKADATIGSRVTSHLYRHGR